MSKNNARDKELMKQSETECGFDSDKFADLIREDEREQCAKLVEAIEARCIAEDIDDPTLEHVAKAIRARSKT